MGGFFEMLGALGGGFVQGRRAKVQMDAQKQEIAQRAITLQAAQAYQKWINSQGQQDPGGQDTSMLPSQYQDPHGDQGYTPPSNPPASSNPTPAAIVAAGQGSIIPSLNTLGTAPGTQGSLGDPLGIRPSTRHFQLAGASRNALYAISDAILPLHEKSRISGLWAEYPTAPHARKTDIDNALRAYQNTTPYKFNGKGEVWREDAPTPLGAQAMSLPAPSGAMADAIPTPQPSGDTGQSLQPSQQALAAPTGASQPDMGQSATVPIPTPQQGDRGINPTMEAQARQTAYIQQQVRSAMQAGVPLDQAMPEIQAAAQSLYPIPVQMFQYTDPDSGQAITVPFEEAAKYNLLMTPADRSKFAEAKSTHEEALEFKRAALAEKTYNDDAMNGMVPFISLSTGKPVLDSDGQPIMVPRRSLGALQRGVYASDSTSGIKPTPKVTTDIANKVADTTLKGSQTQHTIVDTSRISYVTNNYLPAQVANLGARTNQTNAVTPSIINRNNSAALKSRQPTGKSAKGTPVYSFTASSAQAIIDGNADVFKPVGAVAAGTTGTGARTLGGAPPVGGKAATKPSVYTDAHGNEHFVTDLNGNKLVAATGTPRAIINEVGQAYDAKRGGQPKAPPPPAKNPQTPWHSGVAAPEDTAKGLNDALYKIVHNGVGGHGRIPAQLVFSTARPIYAQIMSQPESRELTPDEVTALVIKLTKRKL